MTRPRILRRVFLGAVAIVILVCVIGGCIFLSMAQQARREERVLSRVDCHVEYRDIGPKWLRTLLPEGGRWILRRAYALNMQGTDGEACSAVLAALPDLRELTFSGCKHVDEILAHLPADTKLEFVAMEESKVTNRGLAYLRTAEKLRCVELYNMGPLEVEELETLAEIPNLTSLGLHCVDVPEADRFSFASFSSLEYLCLLSNTVTGEHAQGITAIPGLKGLAIGGVQLRSLAVENMAALFELRIDAPALVDMRLHNLPALEEFGFLGDGGLPGPAPMLQDVILDGVPLLHCLNVSHAPLQSLVLRDTKSLKTLMFTCCSVPTFHLEGNVPLATLAVAGQGLNDESSDLLPLPRTLTWLAISNTSISDATIARLSQLPNLHRLEITDTDVTDSGLKMLVGMRSLEEVVLPTGKTTEEGIRQFFQAAPHIRGVFADFRSPDGQRDAREKLGLVS